MSRSHSASSRCPARSGRSPGRPTVRTLAAVALACAFSTLWGCSHEAGAKSREPLVLTVEGSAEDRYGVEIVASCGDLELLARPLGPDGRVQIADVPCDEVRVTLRDPKGRFVTRSDLLPSSGDHALSLVPGTYLRLTVLGAGGEIVEPARVTVCGGRDGSRDFTLSGRNASIGPLPPGDFKFVVSSPGYETRVLDLNVRQPRQAGVVRDLPDLELARGGATLRGKLDAKGRHALHAFLRHGGAGQEIDVRPDGSFALAGLPVDSGVLEATLVVRDDTGDLLARDLRITGDVNLGRIPLD